MQLGRTSSVNARRRENLEALAGAVACSPAPDFLPNQPQRMNPVLQAPSVGLVCEREARRVAGLAQIPIGSAQDLQSDLPGQLFYLRLHLGPHLGHTAFQIAF
jgi:hypothetical protein